MTRDEAAALATNIKQTWTGGIPTGAWEDELMRLDAGRAGTTFVQLRRELERSPSIAQFLARYGAMDTGGPNHADCPRCDNHGWLTVWADEVGGDTRGVTPCRCPWGQAVEQSHRNALERNAAELARLFPNRHQTPSRPPTREDAA